METDMTVTKGSSALTKTEQAGDYMNVGMLATGLSRHFPEADGEEWDTFGLAVGDPLARVETVAVALDATVSAVRRAAQAGAQVLVTHHPAYLEAPKVVVPTGNLVGTGIQWEAVTSGVAVMSFHTACDASSPANTMLCEMLSLNPLGVAAPLAADSSKGYGQWCAPKDGERMTVSNLASRCTAVFGTPPRVWGDFGARVDRVLTWGGSLGSFLQDRPLPQTDCVICGEIGYHKALALAESGIAVIELGHDVSELPLTLLLASAVEECGIPRKNIKLLDGGPHWAYPESIRL